MVLSISRDDSAGRAVVHEDNRSLTRSPVVADDRPAARFCGRALRRPAELRGVAGILTEQLSPTAVTYGRSEVVGHFTVVLRPSSVRPAD